MIISKEYKLKTHTMKNICNILFLAMLPLILPAQQFVRTDRVVAPDRAKDDFLGRDMAISGRFAIMGSENGFIDIHESNFLDNSGSAYIYRKTSNGNWEFYQKLVSPDRQRLEFFGSSVAIDGNIAIVGADGSNFNELGQDSLRFAGAAYVFELNPAGDIWEFTKKLVPDDREAQDHFGNKVSLSNNTVAITALYDDPDTSLGVSYEDVGSVYIFQKTVHGQWFQITKLQPDSLYDHDLFGHDIDINGDRLVVGAIYANTNPIQNRHQSAGAAYFYERDANNQWNLVNKVFASDFNAKDFFGAEVALYNGTAAITAYGDDEDSLGANHVDSAGSVYIFEFNGQNWVETQKVSASHREYHNMFGSSVDINDNFLVVGARRERDPPPSHSVYGAVYVFVKENGKWKELQRIVENDIVPSDYFGYSVYLDSAQFVVGNSIGVDLNNSNYLNTAGMPFFYEYDIYYGVDEQVGHTGAFRAYPNPTNGKVFVELSGNQGNFDITVYNLLGEQIHSENVSNTNRAEIMINGPPGTYILQVRSEDLSEVVKVVKQ